MLASHESFCNASSSINQLALQAPVTSGSYNPIAICGIEIHKEVFTLDSATCAACTYMMGAANEAKKTFGDAIDMVEYKFTLKENIARCKKMGVPNLPSMYINGELKFRSLVPSKEELEGAIRAAMK